MRPLYATPRIGPRCSWIQRLIDRELDEQMRASYVYMTLPEVMNLRRDALRKGHDPYNSADATPQWLKYAVPQREPVPKIRGVFV